MELKDWIKHDSLQPSFAFNEFHGSAVMFLYPYINLLPAVVLSFFIKSKILLIYFFFGFNTFISLINCFYSSWIYKKSIIISYLFSLIYSLSAPFSAYYYANMDLGVVTSCAFLPLVIFGFLYLFKNNKYWILLPIGYIFIIYSHVLTIFIVFGLLFIWLILNLYKINKFILYKLFISFVIILLLTSFIWVPAINLVVHNINNIQPLKAPDLTGYNIIYVMKLFVLDKPNYCLGIFSIIGIILALVVYPKLDCFMKQMLYISIIIIIICSNIFPWKYFNSFSIFKLLKLFQFTYRFYIIPQIFLSYLVAFSIYKCTMYVFNNSRSRLIILLLVSLFIIILQIFCQINIIHINNNDNEFNTRFISKNSCKRNELHHAITNKGIKSIYIKDKVIKYNLNKPYGSVGYSNPKIKFLNSKQIDLFIRSNIFGSANLDYYPVNSIYSEDDINNKLTYYDNNIRNTGSTFCHIGFNRFRFNSHRHAYDISLPIMLYHGENIKVYRNKHNVRYFENKYGLLTIHNVKGSNIIYIKCIPNKLVCITSIILLIFGLIFLVSFILK